MTLEVNATTCISCGKCAEECLLSLISMDNSIPYISPEKESACMDCQHCMAVCPKGALSINGKKPEDSISIKNFTPNAENIEMLVKSRRSCRSYKQKDVSPELLEKLLNTSAYAPTALNAMGVSFTVIDKLEEMIKFRAITKDILQKKIEDKTLPEIPQFLLDYIKIWMNGNEDIIFRTAPHILITSAPSDSANPQMDSSIAMAYFDLIATANGLGTVWIGLLKSFIERIAPELKEKLGIPENHTIGFVMGFGYPAVKYHRTTQRKPSRIKRVKLL